MQTWIIKLFLSIIWISLFYSLLLVFIFYAPFTSAQPHLDIPNCTYENEIYNSFKMLDTGSMDFKNGTSLYYSIEIIPKVNDIVGINEPEEVIGINTTGFAHRIVYNLFNRWYITKGDNNEYSDGIYSKDKIDGVIICKKENG